MESKPWPGFSEPREPEVDPTVLTWGTFGIITAGQHERIHRLSKTVRTNMDRHASLLAPGGESLRDAHGEHYRGSWQHVLESAIRLLERKVYGERA